jgi:hypothetical protein
MDDRATAMTATLSRLCDEISAADVTAEGLARELGDLADGASTNQLTVRPHDDAWARIEIISRAGEDAPALVRMTPADPDALAVADLDAVFGEPATLPPKVHFTDPVSRSYEVDTGKPTHTAAVIAELRPEGGDHVTAVVLRRDIRL